MLAGQHDVEGIVTTQHSVNLLVEKARHTGQHCRSRSANVRRDKHVGEGEEWMAVG